MAALRRGAHWQLVQLQESPFGPIDEAQLLADSLAEVMKYVPLPDRELGVVAAVSNLGIALYSTVGSRLAIDRAIAEGRVQMSPPSSPSATATRAPAPASPPAASPPSPSPAPADATAADLLDGIRATHGDAPLGIVTHEPTGDTVNDGVQLGTSVTALLPNDADPEPALLEAFRPGAHVVPIEELVAQNGAGVPLLDRLAPAPEVDGVPASPELGGTGPVIELG